MQSAELYQRQVQVCDCKKSERKKKNLADDVHKIYHSSLICADLL